MRSGGSGGSLVKRGALRNMPRRGVFGRRPVLLRGAPAQDASAAAVREIGNLDNGRTGAIELTVVVPTFNEAENVPLVVERLDAVLKDVVWEVVFVDDDSPDRDGRGRARNCRSRDRRVRVIRRIGRRGLSTACVEGVLSSSAPYFAVMDGDLQHDDTHAARDARQGEGRQSRYRGRQPLPRRRAHAGLASDVRKRISRLGGGWRGWCSRPTSPIR